MPRSRPAHAGPGAEPESAPRAAARGALAAAVFAAVHSVLASRRVKRAAEHLVGVRAARGGYRLAYNAVAIGTTAALTAYVLRHRGPFVYTLRGRAAGAVRLGQFAALGLVLRSAIDAGLAALSGFGPGWRWLTDRPLAPIPDSQGPPERSPGDFERKGVFAYVRQPLNVFSIPVLWLTPRASAARLGVNGVLTGYLVLGSYHAEEMMREREGEGGGWRARPA